MIEEIELNCGRCPETFYGVSGGPGRNVYSLRARHWNREHNIPYSGRDTLYEEKEVEFLRKKVADLEKRLALRDKALARLRATMKRAY